MILKGGFPVSGGSKERPRLDPYKETVVEVRDVPREAAIAARREFPDQVKLFGDSGPQNPVDPVLMAMEAERDKLQKVLGDLEDQIAVRRASTTLPTS